MVKMFCKASNFVTLSLSTSIEDTKKSFFLYSGHQLQNHLNGKETPERHSEDCFADELQARWRVVGAEDSRGQLI